VSNRKKARTAGTQTTDSIQNFLTRTGHGTGNLNDGAKYGFNPVTRNRLLMEWTYRGSWIAGRAVDCVAKDMTREGIELKSTVTPDQLQAFDKEISRLQIWKQLCATIKWSRLYGGALAFMMIDGQDQSTPLRIETLRKGQFKGLLPLDRWVVQPSLQNLVSDFGPNYGKPQWYDTLPDTGGMPRMKIHHSRVIRLEGVELPYWQRISENLWGQSVLERLWDRMIAFDSTTAGIAQLVYKAHLRTYKVKGLRDMIAGNQIAMGKLAETINMIRVFQSNEGLTLMDAQDEFETHQYAFGGLDAVLVQMGEQLCGALETPAVRLFGQSPAGFNSGDSDLRNYYDKVKQDQVADLGPGCETLYHVAYVSTFGQAPPKQFELSFKSLWLLSDEQKATVGNQSTAAINTAYESQIIDRATALRELKQQSRVSGLFTNITDEQITEAESDPAPSPGALGLTDPKPPKGDESDDEPHLTADE
jgi:phage-related protein (TIGR01555 family)